MKPEFKKAAGHWPFSVQFSTMATQKFDHDYIKVYRWPTKISAWSAKPKALFLALETTNQCMYTVTVLHYSCYCYTCGRIVYCSIAPVRYAPPVHLQGSSSSTRAATTSQPSPGGARRRATRPPSPSPGCTPEKTTPRAWRCLIR